MDKEDQSITVYQALKHDFLLHWYRDGIRFRHNRDIYHYCKLYQYMTSVSYARMNTHQMREQLKTVLDSHSVFQEYKTDILSMFEENKLSNHCSVEDMIQWYIYFYKEYTIEDVFYYEIKGE